jgi:hypothetical protein
MKEALIRKHENVGGQWDRRSFFVVCHCFAKRARHFRERARLQPCPSSLAKAIHVLWVLGEVLGQALDRTGKVAGQVVARRRRGPRWLAQSLFQVVPDELGFRHPPQLSLAFELSQKIVRQFQRNRPHDRSVRRADLLSNTPSAFGSNLPGPNGQSRFLAITRCARLKAVKRAVHVIPLLVVVGLTAGRPIDASQQEPSGHSFLAQMQQLAQALSLAYAQSDGLSDLSGLAAKMAAAGSPLMRDAWGTPLHLERKSSAADTPPGEDLACFPLERDEYDASWRGNTQKITYLVRSAGPDRRFGNGDDLVAYLNARSGIASQSATGVPEDGLLLRPSVIDFEVQRDGDPTGRPAEIVGSARNRQGVVMPRVRVEARDISASAVYLAVTDSKGGFALAGLPAGTYAVRFVYPGAQPVWSEIAVTGGERAVLTARLELSPYTEGDVPLVCACIVPSRCLEQ